MAAPGRMMEIAGRRIGPAAPPYIIAELSGNHGGSLDTALNILKAAAAAGADAVKLQTYTAETMTIRSSRPEFRVEGMLWSGRQLYDLYDEAHTPWDWHPVLFQCARELGVTLFSTPFDRTAVDFLERLDAPAYKIASAELVDIPLIRHAASTGKPLIMSTGAANESEVDQAMQAARQAGAKDIILLHCLMTYPAPAEEFNLRTIPALAERYDCLAGLSDHSLGIEVAIAATAVGASVIEKHVVDSRAAGAVDSAFSLEPPELKALVQGTRLAHAALGQPYFGYAPSEEAGRRYRRSLYAVRDIAAGERFTAENVRAIRPANGLAPARWDEVMQSVASRAIVAGTPLEASMIAAAAAGGNTP